MQEREAAPRGGLFRWRPVAIGKMDVQCRQLGGARLWGAKTLSVSVGLRPHAAPVLGQQYGAPIPKRWFPTLCVIGSGSRPEGTSAHRFSVVFTTSTSGWPLELRRYG